MTDVLGSKDAKVTRRIHKPLMPQNQVIGFGTLATHIGGIPGCSMGTLTTGAKTDRSGRRTVKLGIRGWGPSLHASVMEWKEKVDISNSDPERVGEALIARFGTRIGRQRERSAEAMATVGTPLPLPLTDMRTSCLHLAVDRMLIWAMARYEGRHETPGPYEEKIKADRLRLAVNGKAAEAVKDVIKNGCDTGMPDVTDENGMRIREVRMDGDLLRQITLTHWMTDTKGMQVRGSSIIICGITMPETLRLASRGQRFSALVDVAGAAGKGFAKLMANRVITCVHQEGQITQVDLKPDLIRIEDIGEMTIRQITG